MSDELTHEANFLLFKTPSFDFSHQSYTLYRMSIFSKLIILVIIVFPAVTSAKLEFDAKKNNAQLFGPYIKYNVLKPPYSFGRYEFNKSDISLEFRGVNLPSNDEASGENMPTGKELYVIWPKFLLQYGAVQIISESGNTLLNEDFDSNETSGGDKYVYHRIEDQDLPSHLTQPFRICVKQNYKKTFVEACSDYIKMENGKFKPTKSATEFQKAVATLNGASVPKNAQINIPESQKTLDLLIEFKSGFKIHVKDKVRRLKIQNIAIDPVTKRLGIIGGEGTISTTTLTFKDRFFKFIKEKNYYRNQFEVSQQWPQNIEDAEMEFVPYPLGASAQHYGLILDQIPPPFKFKLADNSPIATYRSVVELEGTKHPKEKLTAKRKNELFIKKDEKSFIWKFSAPEKGVMSQNYLALKHKGDYFYFSRRIFRAHRGSISAAAALSTTTTLSLVPGYNVAADFWPESIWGKKSWAYQRWGLGLNIYETRKAFKPQKGFTEDVSINPINLDIMYRLTPGVRPVEQSFGLALRYLRYQLFRSRSQDLTPRFLGVGALWHLAPQKLVDDVFNIVPFFRYPKWMELSVFYYPLVFGSFEAGFSWSYHAKGRLHFSRDWYFEASINVMAINFKFITDDPFEEISPQVSTIHGTLGFGWMF